MKTTITAALALLLLAGSASAALAQEQGWRHGGRGDGGGADGGGRQGGGQNWRGQNGGAQSAGERPQFRDTERRDMMGGADNRGQRRSEFQADQPRGTPPQAQVAPQAPVAPPAAQPRTRQFRGGDGQGEFRPNRDFSGRQPDAARQPDATRQGGYDRRGDANRDGRRWNGDRNGGDRYDSDRRRYGDRNDWNRNDWNRNGWDRRDDRGRPHWQQGRYPPVYRSHQRYRYGYYNPPVGFYTRSWAFGEILPRSWYGPDYLLNDWWSYDLPYPPPGYDWVRVGDDALLIDSYTGRVVQVVQDIFW
jgi:hypothetical protein